MGYKKRGVHYARNPRLMIKERRKSIFVTVRLVFEFDVYHL